MIHRQEGWGVIQTEEILVELKDVRKHFPAGERMFLRSRDVVKAVDGVGLLIRRGETVGVVGRADVARRPSAA